MAARICIVCESSSIISIRVQEFGLQSEYWIIWQKLVSESDLALSWSTIVPRSVCYIFCFEAIYVAFFEIGLNSLPLVIGTGSKFKCTRYSKSSSKVW